MRATPLIIAVLVASPAFGQASAQMQATQVSLSSASQTLQTHSSLQPRPADTLVRLTWRGGEDDRTVMITALRSDRMGWRIERITQLRDGTVARKGFDGTPTAFGSSLDTLLADPKLKSEVVFDPYGGAPTIDGANYLIEIRRDGQTQTTLHLATPAGGVSGVMIGLLTAAADRAAP